MQLDETKANIISNKFFKAKGWQVINYINMSKIGLNPLLIKRIDDNKLILFDNYTSILNDIKPTIIEDLKANEGWSESFYLNLDDMNSLELYEYFDKDLVDRNLEAYIDDITSMKM